MAGSAGEIHTGPRGWQLRARCMKPLQKMALPEASLPPGIDLPRPPSTRRHHLYERHLQGGPGQLRAPTACNRASGKVMTMSWWRWCICVRMPRAPCHPTGSPSLSLARRKSEPPKGCEVWERLFAMLVKETEGQSNDGCYYLSEFGRQLP